MLLTGKQRASSGLLSVVMASLLGACGARSSVPEGDGTFESPCQTDADCISVDRCETKACVDGFCHLVSTVVCDDGDTCTVDSCVAQTGQCQFEPTTGDADADGHRAIAFGHREGDANACGDDCDDTRADAYPGGRETCDGADNDCNGVIDDGDAYVNPSTPVLVSYESDHESIPAGLTYANGNFAITTIQRDERWHGYFQTVDPDGAAVIDPVLLTLESSDAMAGDLIWTGAVYGTAWEDRRDESYDIYFNRLDAFGHKLGPDVRVTDSIGFSVAPSLLWDGTNWLLAYSDQGDGVDAFSVYVRRLSDDGTVLGDAVAITSAFDDARAPRLLRSEQGLSVLYYVVDEGYRFLRLGDDLVPFEDAVQLPMTNVNEATVRWNGDRYVVAWSTKTDSAGPSIEAMTFDESGETLLSPRVIAGGASMARAPSWVALGDRSLLVWADDYFETGTFELSAQVFDNELSPLDERVRLTTLGAETTSPAAVVGGDGVGVLFRSRALGEWQSFFLRLSCRHITLR